MGETIEQRGRHLGVAEDAGPFAEIEIGGDDHRGSFIEPADEMKEQLAASLREGQIAEFLAKDDSESEGFVPIGWVMTAQEPH